ncbi:MAG: hypothetical protein WCK67_02795 [bacterium]
MSEILSITSIINLIKVTIGLKRPEYKVVPQKKVIKPVEPLLSIEDSRKLVAGLIFEALTRKTCVREAIKRFPPDQFDASIQAAWHALVHFEADEDMRLRDPAYAREQDDYLEMLAFTLQNGTALPLNIIDCYKPYHGAALIPRSTKIKSILKSLIRFII